MYFNSSGSLHSVDVPRSVLKAGDNNPIVHKPKKGRIPRVRRMYFLVILFYQLLLWVLAVIANLSAALCQAAALGQLSYSSTCCSLVALAVFADEAAVCLTSKESLMIRL